MDLYITKKSDADALATHIRNKSGGSRPLEWPQGFINEVDVIPTGSSVAELSFDRMDISGYPTRATFTNTTNHTWTTIPPYILTGGDGMYMMGGLGTYVTDMVMPGSVTIIDENACNNSNLINMTELPYQIEEIRAAAFNNSKISLTSLPDNLTVLGINAFNGCPNLNLETLPEGISHIPTYCFSYSGLSSSRFSLPDTITSIGDYGLSSCPNMTKWIIPASVQSLGKAVFYHSSTLQEVYFLGKPNFPSIGSQYEHIFCYCDSLHDIYVPWSSGEVYGAPWGATNATIHYNWAG